MGGDGGRRLRGKLTTRVVAADRRAPVVGTTTWAPQSTRGSHRLPLQVGRALFFLCLRACCSCRSPVRTSWSGWSPKTGLKNKRIPLDADVAATLAGLTGAGRCLGAVLSFSGRSGENPVGQLLSKRISLLRLHPVVLVVLEPLRLVFILLVLRSCSCCANNNAGGVPVFENPLKSKTCDLKTTPVARKEAGYRYRAPQRDVTP